VYCCSGAAVDHVEFFSGKRSLIVSKRITINDARKTPCQPLSGVSALKLKTIIGTATTQKTFSVKKMT
jgi:hypothetical protein